MWALHFEDGAKTGQIALQCQQRYGEDQVSGIVNTRPNLNQAPNFVTLSRLQQETRS